MSSPAIEHLFEAAEAAILSGLEVDFRTFNLARPMSNDGCYFYLRQGAPVCPFSAFLVLYYPYRPGNDWTHDLANGLGIHVMRLRGMLHGTLYPYDDQRWSDAEFEAGVRDGQELFARVEAFAELGAAK